MKIKILIVGLICLLVFSLGCVQQPEETTTTIQTTTVSVEVDISKCYEIGDQSIQDYCYGGVAIVKEDPLICDKIKNQREREECYRNVIKVALVKQDLSICDKMQSRDYIDSCYFIVALAKNDSSLCEMIKSQYWKDRCHSAIEKSKYGDKTTTTYIIPRCIGFSQIKPIDWKADSSDNKIVLILTNEAGVKVSLDSVSVDVFDNTCSKNVNEELRAGQSIQVNITECTFPSIGDYYKAEISIDYTNLVSKIKHRSVGVCEGAVK